jgi:transposase
MEPIFVRKLNRKERDFLYDLIEDKKIGYRAKIIILSYEGYTPPQIEKAINMHVKNIRKWIHRFNEYGIEGILEKKRTGRKPKFNEKTINQILKIIKKPPYELNLPFSTWSLRKLEAYLKNKGIDISHTRIRQLLLKHGFKFLKSKQELISKDPNYEAKMLRIKRLLKKPNCIVLFEDEKRIALKLYNGYKWRMKKEIVPLNQKVRKFFYLFGIYNPHENLRYFSFYEEQRSRSFVDFMNKIAKKFKDKIYLILDNHRSHTSKYTRKNLSKKVKLVFLPFNTPKLNRIEDEFSLYNREVLSNRSFKSKKELLKATRKWINYRNKMGIR